LKYFALTGVGGYIAPRHLKAIKETGNRLVAAFDVNDSVGVLDSYFPDAVFFTVAEEFEQYLQQLKNSGTPVDYLSVCSPNHVHEEHVLLGFRVGADVICEKPVVLTPESLTLLEKAAIASGKKVSTIMQLRLHPSIVALKERISKEAVSQRYAVDVQYITARGQWYHNSWKGDIGKSGGIATNIGIHLFDMLLWLFGVVKESRVSLHTAEKAAGTLILEKADVNWELSIDENDLPVSVRNEKKRIFRSLMINNEEIDFSEGLMTLHTASYEAILAGNGFCLETTGPSVQLVTGIRNTFIQ
jgi:UDP-N-acetyl-2-amino-2-deoxyglucuronate dehydrogenase